MFKPKYADNILRPSLRGRERQIRPQHESNEDRQAPATFGRWSAIGHIAGRQVRRSLSGWPFYGAAVIALAVVIGLLYCTVWFAGEAGLYVLSRPSVLPMQVVTTAGCLFVLFGAALSHVPSRRRVMRRPDWSAGGDRPTLVAARFLAWVVVYGLLLLILIPLLALLTRGANLIIPPALLWSLIPSLVCAGLAVSVGLFIAAAAPTREAAVAIAAAVVVTSLALQSSHLVLASLPPANPYQAILPLLRAGQQLLPYVSPFAASDAMLDAALRSDLPASLRLMLVTLLNAALWLGAAWLTLRRRNKLP
jgi:hypothetical protein